MEEIHTQNPVIIKVNTIDTRAKARERAAAEQQSRQPEEKKDIYYSDRMGVMNKLPIFKGKRKNEDRDWREGPSLKTFLEALENHFGEQGIHDDRTKVQIFCNQLDKESGDNQQTLNLTKDSETTYEELKRRFKDTYEGDSIGSNLKKSTYGLRNQIRAGFNFNISARHEMSKLDTNIREAVGAYMLSERIRDMGITENSIIETEVAEISIKDFLINHLLYLTLGPETTDKQWKKIERIPFDTKTRTLTSRICAIIDADKSTFRGRQEESRYGNRRDTVYGVTRRRTFCTNCRNVGHTREQCRINMECTFCKIPGHTINNCRRRKQGGYNSNGSVQQRTRFCGYCRVRGHEEIDCFKKKNDNRRCSTCGKVGHREESCFQTKQRSEGNSQKEITCAYCNTKGHSSITCYKKKNREGNPRTRNVRMMNEVNYDISESEESNNE